jgi:hypothetical protein
MSYEVEVSVLKTVHKEDICHFENLKKMFSKYNPEREKRFNGSLRDIGFH